ncbi:MAG TPA: acyl-CoA synthetase [Streptosporangiaceae bacterium]|nr:acyl-CoA synthetase [Streptosporangiaceae bacterium]
MHLSELAAAAPDKPAVITADGDRVLTYGDLDRRSRQVSRLLASLGVGTGDHVALLLPNRPEYFEVAWGAQRRGTYWTPVNWHLTAEEAGYIVADCGARVLFAAAETAQAAAQIAFGQPGLAVFVAGREPGSGQQSYEAAISAQSADPLADEVDGAVFFYSSGTTGRPKGIKPSHTFPPFGSPATLPQLMGVVFGFGPDSVYLCPAPLYHAAPNNFCLGTHRLGGTVVLMDRFDPAGCLRAIEAHRVSHVQFVPTHFVRLLRLPDEQRLAFDVSSLRTVVHAAAPCPPEVKRQMIDWLGPCLVEYYAGSEANGVTLIDSADWLAHPGSVGRAVGAAVHIVGDDGAELPAGQDGLIYFESQTFEYHNDPAKTASARDDRGWSTLGDIGHLDEEGYLYLSDRRTDLIISGGVNIYPAEVEAVLIGHPAVDDVAVIGVPDPEMGQLVLAIVQLSDEGTGSPDLAAELIEHCRARLASFKCPRSIEFVADLPRLPTGKLLRRQLRAERAGQDR